MKARKLAVCTVGLMLALLLGELPLDQIHPAVGTNASAVYAAYSEVARVYS
jgi:hypothetical protein